MRASHRTSPRSKRVSSRTAVRHLRSAPPHRPSRAFAPGHFPDPLKSLSFLAKPSFFEALYQPIHGGPKAGGARLIVFKTGEQQVILPNPIDAQVLAGKDPPPQNPFLPQPDRRHISRAAR